MILIILGFFLLVFLVSCGITCYLDPYLAKIRSGECCRNKKDDKSAKKKKDRKSKSKDKKGDSSVEPKKSNRKSSVKNGSKAANSAFKSSSRSGPHSLSFKRVEPTKTDMPDYVLELLQDSGTKSKGKMSFSKSFRGVFLTVPKSLPSVVPAPDDPHPSKSIEKVRKALRKSLKQPKKKVQSSGKKQPSLSASKSKSSK